MKKIVCIAVLVLAAASVQAANVTLYPGLDLFERNGSYHLGMKIALPHGTAYTYWPLERSLPEVQQAVNAWCADAMANPPVDQAKTIDGLNYRIRLLESDVTAKQATIEAMNANYAEQEKRIRELAAQVTDLTAQLAAAQKKQSGGGLFNRLFGR